MYKVIGLLKKNPAMTTAEFREYYERNHRVIGEKYLRGLASRYVRRYLDPFADPITGRVVEQAHDVLLEIWYNDRAAFEQAGQLFLQPAVMQEIAADEEKLFDRSASRFFAVTEVESTLA